MADCEAECGRKGEMARAQRARAEQLDAALGEMREACLSRNRRIAWLEAELDLSRSQAASRERALAVVGAELERLRVGARGQATALRLEALREAAEVSLRARRLEGAPEGGVERLLRSLERAIERIAAGHEEMVEAAAGQRGPEAPAVEAPLAAAGLNGGDVLSAPVEGEPTPAAEANGHGGARRVQVDIGPFRDFSQLVSFEDAANSIGATGEISIRRFSEGRADIDVDLTEPADLLRELEQRCDLEFRVRAQGDERIILDLGD